MPDSSVLGWRCCSAQHDAADARRPPPRSARKSERAASARVPDLGEVLRLEAPALAAVPRLALPDRHGAPSARRWRSGRPRTPRRGAARDTATTTAASPSSHDARCGAAARPGRRPATGARTSATIAAQPRRGVLLVGLVLEAVHAGPALGVVARGAGEGDDGAAVGPDHPRARGRPPAAARRLSATQSSPDAGAAAASAIHPGHLRWPAVLPAGAATTVCAHVHGRRRRRRRRRSRPTAATRRPALAPPVGGVVVRSADASPPRRRRSREPPGGPGVADRRWSPASSARCCAAACWPSPATCRSTRRRVVERVTVTPIVPASRICTTTAGVDALEDERQPRRSCTSCVTTADGDSRASGVVVRDDGRRPHERPRGRRRRRRSPSCSPTAARWTATLVGADLPTDVAVVTIEADGLTVAVLGSVGRPRGRDADHGAIGWPTGGAASRR